MWYDKCLNRQGERSKTILVGAKSDLAQDRQVSYQEGMLIAEELGLNYIEVSAITGHNIKNMFDIITRKIRSTGL